MSTYTPIATTILSSAAASITFSSLPQNYTDLVLVVSGTMSGSGNSVYVRMNGDTSGNYSSTMMGANGSTALSYRWTNNVSGLAGGGFNWGYTTSPFALNMQFMNYSNTTTTKTVLSRWSQAGGTNAATESFASQYRSTNAVTSITVRNSGVSDNFNAGTTFNLYGIDASLSAQAKATGGNSIYTDGTNWYHIFTSSGTFVPTQNISNVDYLVVAGGGSGGAYYGAGGGGAGGLRCTVTATGGGGSLESKLSLVSGTSYVVTVGAGGSQSAGGQGADGSNSSIIGGSTSIISIGGGGGASGRIGNSGGSGGGGGRDSAGTSYAGGAGTANQGYAGGSGTGGSGAGRGGGGGGAGAVGSNAGGGGGAGGNGVATSITNSSVTYAGGGGGGGQTGYSAGSGGTGGGGAGGSGNPGNGTAGTVNSGSGGGGGGQDSPAAGGSGGSGIVIVRYAV